MKTYALATVGALLIAGCSSQAQTVSAVPGETSRTYTVAGFSALDISSGIEAKFSAGGAQSVLVENENGAWDKIEVKVEDDTLVLKRPYTSGLGYTRNKEKFLVTISAPVLSSLEASSGALVSGTGLSGDDVLIDMSSGSNVSVTDIDASQLTVDTSSGSNATLSGTCSKVSIDTSSGSNVRAGQLVCQYASIDSSSGSNVSVTATQSLTAEASSGASVKVGGAPLNTDISKSSGGSVKVSD